MKKTNITFHYPDKSFYFSHQQRLGYHDMPSNHFHNKYELYYLLSGERYYFIKNKILHIMPGNLVLINKNDLHKTIDADAAGHIRTVINFDKNFILSSSYINDNFSAPLSLSSVSQRFFISQYYLSRTFKETTGFTFIEYLNSIRIREAQLLLLETNHPITMIAEKVGFGSISHFGRVFKTITKASPMAFRKQHKERLTQ